MATFYVGPRPVLKGRNTKEMINPYKGTSGTYSYYPLWSTSHVLDGAPDKHFAPGTGQFPGNRFLSQLFNGTNLYLIPLSGTFPDGAHFDGARFRPHEYKGLDGARAFAVGFGHEYNRANAYHYNNYIFDGVASADIFLNTGHGQRTEAQGAPSSFGYFIPDAFHGVTSTTVFPTAFGQALPAGYDNPYGHNRVKEYRGVPSARAL